MTKITYIPGEIANAAIDENGNRKPVTRTKHIFDDTLNKTQSQVNEETTEAISDEVTRAQNTESSLDTRLQTVEELAEISVGGGDIGIGTAADFESDDPSAQAKVPTVGAILGGANDGVYDISARHNGTKYADLADALGTDGINVPVGVRRGGMSVKFVQTSDNKYFQFRLKGQNFTTNESDWVNVEKDLFRYENVTLAANTADDTSINLKNGNRYYLFINSGNAEEVNGVSIYAYPKGLASNRVNINAYNTIFTFVPTTNAVLRLDNRLNTSISFNIIVSNNDELNSPKELLRLISFIQTSLENEVTRATTAENTKLAKTDFIINNTGFFENLVPIYDGLVQGGINNQGQDTSANYRLRSSYIPVYDSEFYKFQRTPWKAEVHCYSYANNIYTHLGSIAYNNEGLQSYKEGTTHIRFLIQNTGVEGAIFPTNDVANNIYVADAYNSIHRFTDDDEIAKYLLCINSVDGYYLSGSNTLSKVDGWSVSPYIEAVAGDVIKVKCGKVDSTNRYLVAVNSNYERVDFYNIANSAEREITLPANTAFIRFCYYTSAIKNVYIKKSSNGEYLFRYSWLLSITKPEVPTVSVVNRKKITIGEWNVGGWSGGVSSYPWINNGNIVYTANNTPVAGETGVYPDFACLGERIGIVSAVGTDTITCNNITYDRYNDGYSSNSGIPNNLLDEVLPSIKSVITKLGADILLLNEYSEYLDRNNSIDTYTTLFEQFYPYKVVGSGSISVAVLSRYPLTLTEATTTTGRKYLKGIVAIEGKECGLVCIHLTAYSAQDRINETTNIISTLPNAQLCIIGGDMNTGNNSESSADIELQITPYETAGFTLGNRGYWGTIGTYKDGKALDNIMTRDGAMTQYSVLEEKSVSDHYPSKSNFDFVI